MLLKQYEEANNIDGIKYELAKLWYMNTLLEDKIKNSKGSEKQEYTKTRTRILNDFNKYLKIVLKEDKKFNFNRYYKNTPYGDDRVRIRNSTLKYGLKNIRRIITG
jgi:protein tyrosine phosphatase